MHQISPIIGLETHILLYTFWLGKYQGSRRKNG